MSTCSVYGANEGLLDETSVVNPLSVYAVTKLKRSRTFWNVAVSCCGLVRSSA